MLRTHSQAKESSFPCVLVVSLEVSDVVMMLGCSDARQSGIFSAHVKQS